MLHPLQQPSVRWYQHTEAGAGLFSRSQLQVRAEGHTEGTKCKWSKGLPACELQPPMPLHPLHNINARLSSSERKSQ